MMTRPQTLAPTLLSTAPRLTAGLTAGLALAGLLGLAGCGAGAAPDSRPMAADTVRGTVRVVGADPITRVVIRTGDAAVTVDGSAADALRRVNGLEVMARGRLEAGTLDAVAFRVRAVDGMPAVDGVLEIDGDAAILVTPDGRRVRYSPVPSALRSRVGARVWIAGEIGGEPQAWGIIGDP